MAVYFRGEQRKFDANWERAKVITRLQVIWRENFPMSVSYAVPGQAVVSVLSGLVRPQRVEGSLPLYAGLGVRITHMGVEGKGLCNVRTTGKLALNALYDLHTTASELARNEPTQAEAQVDEFLNRILARPLFDTKLGELTLGNVIGQPTVEVAPDMAWHLLAPGFEAQLADDRARTQDGIAPSWMQHGNDRAGLAGIVDIQKI